MYKEEELIYLFITLPILIFGEFRTYSMFTLYSEKGLQFSVCFDGVSKPTSHFCVSAKWPQVCTYSGRPELGGGLPHEGELLVGAEVHGGRLALDESDQE